MKLKDYKQRKERGYSVKDAVEELDKCADDYESIIIIGINNNKAIDVSFSGDSDAELIGLLEVAKSILVDQIRD